MEKGEKAEVHIFGDNIIREDRSREKERLFKTKKEWWSSFCSSHSRDPCLAPLKHPGKNLERNDHVVYLERLDIRLWGFQSWQRLLCQPWQKSAELSDLKAACQLGHQAHG